VPVDHLLVKEVRDEVLLLDSGCVCCSIRGDLVDALLAEGGTDAPNRFDRVFVETTGVADPTPIVATLVRHPGLSRHYHLDAVVTAVDAEHGGRTLQRHDEARKQVLLADDIVVTKVDVVGAGALAEVHSIVAERNPRARLFFSERGLLDWRPLLEWTPSTVASRLDVTSGPPHGSGEVRSFTVRADGAVDYRSFALRLSMISQFHGENLLRVKGLLRVDDAPGPVVVQAVQHVVYPTYSMPRWPTDDHSSRLVVITRGMPAALVASLRSSLEALLGARATRATEPLQSVLPSLDVDVA
jgi:G3E family GTPase